MDKATFDEFWTQHSEIEEAAAEYWDDLGKLWRQRAWQDKHPVYSQIDVEAMQEHHFAYQRFQRLTRLAWIERSYQETATPEEVEKFYALHYKIR